MLDLVTVASWLEAGKFTEEPHYLRLDHYGYFDSGKGCLFLDFYGIADPHSKICVLWPGPRALDDQGCIWAAAIIRYSGCYFASKYNAGHNLPKIMVVLLGEIDKAVVVGRLHPPQVQ